MGRNYKTTEKQVEASRTTGYRNRMTPESFWERVDRSSGTHGCWPWVGKHFAPGGYGRIRFCGTKFRTHRLAMILSGVDVEGYLVCHRCDNPCCCNPSHLFLGTHKDNAKDCSQKRRNPNNRKDYCPKGHPYNEENTYIYWDKKNEWNSRQCRSCARIRRLERAAKNIARLDTAPQHLEDDNA